MEDQTWKSLGLREPSKLREPPRDHALTIFFVAIAIIGLAIGAVISWGVQSGNATYAEFMEGCEHDHKHYECMLLWRASKRDDPTLVPIPIPIPIPR